MARHKVLVKGLVLNPELSLGYLRIRPSFLFLSEHKIDGKLPYLRKVTKKYFKLARENIGLCLYIIYLYIIFF